MLNLEWANIPASPNSLGISCNTIANTVETIVALFLLVNTILIARPSSRLWVIDKSVISIPAALYFQRHWIHKLCTQGNYVIINYYCSKLVVQNFVVLF